MISKKTIDTILETAQIDQVVGDFVNLKRRGANLTGLCPFHHEKSPSFSVSTVRGLFKCFGCGKGGGAVHFVMEHESCSYPEALRYLAQKYHIPIEEENAPDDYREKMQEADSLYIVNKAAQAYYSEQLFTNKYAKDVALAYFKERGLREDLIKKFELGFANGEQADLVKHLQSQQFEPAILEKAGLINQYGKDFFRQRVLFPIHNLAGKVVGFGGRTMSSDKSIPKYINTRETEIYIKNKILYGLHIAKKTIQQKGEAWLTEGYMDVLSLHQAGFTQAIASAGTSLTPGQVSQIKKYAENVTILYDGDAAGMAAAEKAINLFLEQDINPYVVLFPLPEDPDSYVRKVGAAAFEAYVQQNRLDFISFKLKIAPQDPKNPFAKLKTLEEVVKLLAKIREPLKRAVFIKRAADMFEISDEKINQEANKLISTQIQSQQNPTIQTEPEPQQIIQDEKQHNTTIVLPSGDTLRSANPQETQERNIIRLLIQSGQKRYNDNQTVAELVLDNIIEILDEFENVFYAKFILQYIEFIDKNPIPNLDYFINHPDEKVAMLATDLLAPTTKQEYIHKWKSAYILPERYSLEANFIEDTYKSITNFKLRAMQKLCDKNHNKLKESQMQSEKKEEYYTNQSILIHVQMKLIALRSEFVQKTTFVVFNHSKFKPS